jgi:hypothetical protein
MSKMVEPDLSKGVAVRDPRDGEAFRCNPDPGTRIPTHVVRGEGQYYTVARDFLPTFEKEFPGEAKAVCCT